MGFNYLLAAGGNFADDAKISWDEIQQFVVDRGTDFALNVLAALVIFVIGRWFARLGRRLAIAGMRRADIDETLRKFLSNIGYSLLLTFVVVAAVDRLGVDTTSFAAIIAAAGLAIGFALQGSLSNFAAGVLIIIFKPFQVGDYIEGGGTSGVVEEVHVFHTLMRTGDNIRIVVPNSQMTGDTIKNYSDKDTRRIDMIIGCGYGDDLLAVKDFLMQTITADERVLTEPEPAVALDELGDSSINFKVRPWVKNEDYWAVKSDLLEAIKLGFDARGFNIPYPTQDVHVHGISA
jgi:small conductance mechanosensitive channel